MNDLPLPELYQGNLDVTQVRQLFSDLREFAEIDGLSLKGGPSAMTNGENTTSLAEAEALLSAHQVMGVQIRYRYQDKAWFDTLLRRDDGVRVVRIEAP